MINDTPVFLLASERSGTNLLRKLITQHQDVYFGPSPAHFLKHLFYREPYYGNLENDDNFLKMIEDALNLCYIHFSPWSIKLESKQILSEYEKQKFKVRNSVYLSHLLMTLYANEQGYKTYFCKDNFLFDFTFEILHYLPNAKFIYLHRDPRDYAVSQLERTAQTNSLLRIANLWRYEQVKCISAYQKLNSEQIFKLSYEELIADSQKKITEICDFLQVNYVKEEKNAEIFTGKTQEWQNLSKSVMKNNSNKYLKKFSDKQIKLVESIVELPMEYLQYHFEYDSSQKISKFYRLYDLIKGEISARVMRKVTKVESSDAIKARGKFANKIHVKWQKSL